MKKVLVILALFTAIAALIVLSRLTLRGNTANTFAEVKRGVFEISVSNSGELIAEKSIDIWGPGYGKPLTQNDSRMGIQGGGNVIRQQELKIQDIVPEGTIVREGDYVAQLDRTPYDNALKDQLTILTTLQSKMEMSLLDTAVTLTTLRDEIKNQRFAVEEAGIVVNQSKFEPPASIRLAQINLDKANRALVQLINRYDLRNAQKLAEINNQQKVIVRQTRYINELQDFLTKLTIKAPASGMVIYAKDRSGPKRTAGTMVDPFDEIIATLPDLSSMISKTYVNEIEISSVKPDQKVNILVDAFPEKTYTGKVISIANIGEKLPNSDSKMFEVLIKVTDNDPTLRPSMTTSNKIIIKTIGDAVFIPLECVQTGVDSIPIVYVKSNIKQIVVLGESNEKNIIVKQGLEPGSSIYIVPPDNSETFRVAGENLIPVIKKLK